MFITTNRSIMDVYVFVWLVCLCLNDVSAAGPQGPKGEPGNDGLPGPTGNPGIDGFSGLPGVPGITGDPGVPGFDGSKGDAGDHGEPGIPGIPGLPGMKGEAGQTGLSGLSGVKGVKGGVGIGRKGVDGDSGICDTETCEEDICEDSYVSVFFKNDIKATSNPEDNIVYRFEAPRTGVYLFLVTSKAHGNGAVDVMLLVDDQLRMRTGRSSEDAVGVYPVGYNHITLDLPQGKEVVFQMKASGGGFWDSIKDRFKDPSDVTINSQLLFETGTNCWN